MNNYCYDEIVIGQTDRFSIQITQEMQNAFLDITGDNNPMHIDEAYAQSKGFRGKLVYGMLTASFYSTFVGVLLPGKKCLLQDAEIKFRKPVFIGDVLEIKGECVDKYDTFKQLLLKVKIYNQNKELVSSAKLNVAVGGTVIEQ